MINTTENYHINEQLSRLYKENTADFLDIWAESFHQIPPPRINEFGIIDPHRYDTDHGILFIGRETNGWSNEDYQNGCLFRNWLYGISKNGIYGCGHIQKHPNMWYNIGRWATLLQSKNVDLDTLACQKNEAIRALGTIAFTNVNKVRGTNTSGKEYDRLSQQESVKALLQAEIDLIRPHTIVCCGTWHVAKDCLRNFHGKVIQMPHPGARTSTLALLDILNQQL